MNFWKFTISMFLFLGIATNIFAQEQARSCATMEYLELQKQEDPKQEFRMEMIEHFTQRIQRKQGRAITGVITIPVVVHVVYNNSAENISDAQIASQMAILNEDFRRTNSDADNVWSQASDVEIEFCLASQDPNGNPTNGITRTSTSRSSFSSNNFVKFDANGGKDAWPAADYLNFWVCDLNGLLGYAQFPGGSASTDGIVCDYAAVGDVGAAAAPFDLGRTATHEIGHWLNLRHIWGDGGCSVDDFVSDTPVSDASNTGCALGHVSCGTVDMVQNYMDYSDDACMNLFTVGQRDRMRALFEPGGAKESLLSSPACTPPAAPTCTDGIQNGNETGVDCGGPDCPACPPAPTCTDGIQNGNETGVDCGGPDCAPCPCNGTDVDLSIKLDNYPEETSWTLKNSSGTTIASGGTYGSQPDGSTISESFCLPDGCYDFTINDTYGDGICCSYGNGSYTISAGGTVLASGGNFGSSETKNFCVGGGPAPTCSDGIQNGNETGVDCGGPDCAPCSPNPTCSDGIQNGNETGVDCGGPDCAPCSPNPTCSDGIQNGNETGVDCGGPDCAPCGGGGTDLIFGHYFESGWDGWQDGGSDCFRYSSTVRSYEGLYSIRLRDNSGTRSAMTSSTYDISAYDEVDLNFYFYPNSMEPGEDFFVRYNDGGGWTTVASFASGTDFSNGSFYNVSVTLNSANYNLASGARFRIQCDATANGDQVYIDEVTLTGITGARIGGEVAAPSIQLMDTKPSVSSPTVFDVEDLKEREVGLYPNPAKDQLYLNIPTGMTINALKVYDLSGRLLQHHNNVDRMDHLSIKDLQSGFYFLSIETPDGVINKKFVKD